MHRSPKQSTAPAIAAAGSVPNTFRVGVNFQPMTTAHDVSFLFIELGLVVVGLAVLARLGTRWGFSAIPLYLVAGLALGKGGLAPPSRLARALFAREQT